MNPCAALTNQKLSSNPKPYGNEWTPAQGSQIRSLQAILTPMERSEPMHRTSTLEAFKQPQPVWEWVQPCAGLTNQKLSKPVDFNWTPKDFLAKPMYLNWKLKEFLTQLLDFNGFLREFLAKPMDFSWKLNEFEAMAPDVSAQCYRGWARAASRAMESKITCNMDTVSRTLSRDPVSGDHQVTLFIFWGSLKKRLSHLSVSCLWNAYIMSIECPYHGN